MQAGVTASIDCCNHRRSTAATMPSASTLDSQMPARHASRFQRGIGLFHQWYPSLPPVPVRPCGLRDALLSHRPAKFAWFLIFVQS